MCLPVYFHRQHLLLQPETTVCTSTEWPAGVCKVCVVICHAAKQEEITLSFSLPSFSTVIIAPAAQCQHRCRQYHSLGCHQCSEHQNATTGLLVCVPSTSLAESSTTTRSTASPTGRVLTPSILTSPLTTVCKTHQKCSKAAM
jgi:hypothetical protein